MTKMTEKLKNEWIDLAISLSNKPENPHTIDWDEIAIYQLVSGYFIDFISEKDPDDWPTPASELPNIIRTFKKRTEHDDNTRLIGVRSKK